MIWRSRAVRGLFSIIALALAAGAAAAQAPASAPEPAAPTTQPPSFQQPAAPDPKLSRKDVRSVVEGLADLLASTYVDSARGIEAQRHLTRQLKSGAYRAFEQPRALVARLIVDVQSVLDDDHFNIVYFPPATAGFQWTNANEGPGDEAARLDDERRRLRGTNFGVAKAEILEGNVGWLTIAKFDAPLALFREPLAAAFRMLANTDALIIDLRRNPGGNPECVQLAFSYFLDGPSILGTTRFTRATGQREEFHTFAEPGGPKYLDRPVYVLTGPATGSGAEMFSYQMKHHRKGTLVGAGTSGAAHSFNTYRIDPESGGNVMVLVPDARMIDALTGGDWEKVAVQPDVAASVDEAPAAALKLAVETLLAKAQSEEAKAALSAQLEKMSFAANRALTGQELARYVGRYGIRRVFIEGDALRYQRDNGPPVDLHAVAQDTFELDVPMSPRPRVRFVVEGGDVRAMLLRNSGGEERISRDP